MVSINSKDIDIVVVSTTANYNCATVIRSGDIDAYRVKVTWSDLTAISGTITLKYVRPDGQQVTQTGITPSGNSITFYLPQQAMYIVNLKDTVSLYVQTTNSNLFTPLKITFSGVQTVPAGTAIPDTDEYPDYIQAIADANEATANTNQAASDISAAEELRVTAENDRESAEGLRILAENGRVEQSSADHNFAVSDHNTATSDHEIAGADHTTAQDDHALAGTDHSTASSDHTQAGLDHTQALADSAAISPTVTEVQTARGGQANLDARLDGFDTQLAQTARLHGYRFARALGVRLAAGVEPACLLVQSDSTSDGVGEWFYRTGTWLASKFPAYSFSYRTWNDTNQGYDSPVAIQTGAAGAGYAGMPGSYGKYMDIADAAALDITGDIDISVKVALDDWSVAAGKALASKYGNYGNRSWFFYLNSTNNLGFLFSANGMDLLDATSSVPVAGLVNGTAIWFRVTLDVDNGSAGRDVKFYTSPDGVTWTQVGATRTSAGTSSIFVSTAPIELGTLEGADSSQWAGKYYQAIVRNGIGGPIVASPDLSMAFPKGVTTFKDGEGNTITNHGGGITLSNGSPGVLLMNASLGGSTIAYATDVTRFAKQVAYEPQLAFISYGHNSSTAANYQSTHEGLCTQLLTKWPNVGVVGVTQNPQTTPRTEAQILVQSLIQSQVALASAKNDYGLLDVYRAFKDTGSPASYLGADGLHPNLAGDTLWLNEAIKFLAPVSI